MPGLSLIVKTLVSLTRELRLSLDSRPDLLCLKDPRKFHHRSKAFRTSALAVPVR